MTWSRSVLEEIFNEHEMMVLHRVDLEMDMADTLQEQADRRYEAIAREVIMLEDDNENIADTQAGVDFFWSFMIEFIICKYNY